VAALVARHGALQLTLALEAPGGRARATSICALAAAAAAAVAVEAAEVEAVALVAVVAAG